MCWRWEGLIAPLEKPYIPGENAACKSRSRTRLKSPLAAAQRGKRTLLRLAGHDFEFAFPGVLAGHDFEFAFPGVMRAVLEHYFSGRFGKGGHDGETARQLNLGHDSVWWISAENG